MPEKTCIIIPCYNEAGRLKTQEFAAFVEKQENIDFCFVNDGSKDRTVNILEELCQQMPERMFLLDCPVNQGKAEAVRRGMNYVEGLKKYRWLGFADADLATPLNEVERLNRVFGEEPEALLVMGSRIKRMGVMIERKLFRHYSGRLMATVIAVLFHLNAYDTQCGAKIFDCRLVAAVFASRFISPWLFDVEILLRIRQIQPEYNRMVKEIPLNIWLEQGDSRIRFAHLLKMPLQLGKIYFKYR